ncbi:MAG: hypothetical protein K2X77_25120 [Candidatus Obscuribacterales bacterium]|nr:hypothetical protein [Candidatus Obscuribacterales bacterium]
MQQIKLAAILGSMWAISILPAFAADFRELNKCGIGALRAGDYAKAASLFEEALKGYAPESTRYDDGIKANLKLAQELLSGKSSEPAPKIHSGYVSKDAAVLPADKLLQGKKTAKILRPLLPSAQESPDMDWDLSARNDAYGLGGQIDSDAREPMRGNVMDLASRLRYLMQSANEQRTDLRNRVSEIEARVAEFDRASNLQAQTTFIPRYVPPPPTYLPRTYAPYVPLLPAPGV